MSPTKGENNSCVTLYNANYSSIEMLRTRNKELSVDVSILKRLVYMLNVELEMRDLNMSKSRIESHSYDVGDKSCIPLKPADRILRWNHEDIMMIDPLLQAFQQTKEEKDHLVENYKNFCDDLSSRCKEIILENDSLRKQLRDSKAKTDATYIEWKKLHREFSLVKEHNQLLTRQTKLFQNKMKSIESVYRASIKQYENERQELNEKFESNKSELLLLKGRFSALTQINNQCKRQNDEQHDVNFYNIIAKELKGLSMELKNHNAKDIDSLKKKIVDLEVEKSESDIQLAKLSSERDHLKGYISAVEIEANKLNSRYEELEKELHSVKKSQGDAKKQVIKCMAFIRELVGVHNSLLDRVNERDGMPVNGDES